MEEIPPMFRENHTKPYDFSFVHNLDLSYLCNIKSKPRVITPLKSKDYETYIYRIRSICNFCGFSKRAASWQHQSLGSLRDR